MSDPLFDHDGGSRELGDRERWYAAIAYVFAVCFVSLRKARDSDFVLFHARQGVILFLCECAALAAILLIDQTLGRIPLLGLVVVVALQLVVYCSALFLSVMGFVKALFGERWTMPMLGAYAGRIPRV